MMVIVTITLYKLKVWEILIAKFSTIPSILSVNILRYLLSPLA